MVEGRYFGIEVDGGILSFSVGNRAGGRIPCWLEVERLQALMDQVKPFFPDAVMKVVLLDDKVTKAAIARGEDPCWGKQKAS